MIVMPIFEIMATMIGGAGTLSALISLIFSLVKKENESIKIETNNILKAIQEQSDNDVLNYYTIM